ncbi:MAG TPA: hypothetical protein PKA13_25445 [Geminicoccaceae bacterium]|nr:hypothetical protein [Geminicoccus sp.]HMU53142.1 hypothetical protein [Geminicoccaceae bacterium]
MPFSAVVDLDDIAAGRGGFKIRGAYELHSFGKSVSAAGDVNGDGIGDVLIGGDSGIITRHGSAYIVFGRDGEFPSPVDLGDILADGFEISPETENNLGRSVSSAGDVNGDGIDDLIVGASGSFIEDFGAAYVVFGRTDGFTSSVGLVDIAAGRGGFKIQGEDADDLAGWSVSSVGDLNADGIDDLIVGAPFNGNGGAAYVVFGRNIGFTSPVDLSDIATGSGGFKILGENAFDDAGLRVSAAGDVNGDGIHDLIVGALLNDSAGRNAGAAYVVFGRVDGFTSPVDLKDIAVGRGGFKIQGENASDYAGSSVSAAGDVNGDGIDDLIVGAPERISDEGAAYVVFGRTSRFTSPLDLGDIAAGRGGFKIEGGDHYRTTGGSSAGDVNGDGIDDLIVSASGDDDSSVGVAFVVFGKATGFAASVDLVDIAAGRGGFKIEGGDSGPGMVSEAGDVNGDGIDDLIVGASDNEVADRAGAAYVIFGQPDVLFTMGDNQRDLNDFDLSLFSRSQATRALSGDDVVTLSRTENLGLLFFGNAGDDTITGSAHADRIRGDPGSDTLFGREGNDTLWGNGDADRLDGNRGADRLDGGGDADGLRGGAGMDRLFGRGGNDRADGSDDADTIFGGSGDDRLAGGAGDDIVSGDAGRDHLTGDAGTDSFQFASADHSRPGGADRISDFAPGDLIDLSRIDAVSGGADDAFVFVGEDRFTAPGQLRVYVSGASTILQGNTVGAGHAELKIVILGVHAISETDLVL